jgi:hypothetical integral membrane protein (TIGR02206 family)
MLASIPVLTAVLVVLSRGRNRRYDVVRYSLALLLGAGELAYYGYLLLFDPPATANGLPFQLCNATLWIAFAALLTERAQVIETAFYLGVFGPPIGLLAPQLWRPALSFASLQFFAGHVGVIVSVLYLAGTGKCRPTRAGAVRAFLVLNSIALLLGGLNAALGTNFMFLRTPPEAPAFFGMFGDWPYHLLVGEVVAAAVFGLLAFAGAWRPSDQLCLADHASKKIDGFVCRS